MLICYSWKVCKNIKFISIKSAQSNLYQCITKLKKSKKSKQEWNEACINSNIHPRKLNIPMKTTWKVDILQTNSLKKIKIEKKNACLIHKLILHV
jgi:hypothetical protein